MAIHFFNILFNPIIQCQNRKPRTRKFSAIDTSYIRQVGSNIDKNNVAAYESRGPLSYNFLKCQVYCFTNEIICLVIGTV